MYEHDEPSLRANNLVDQPWDFAWFLKCRWCIKTRSCVFFRCLMGSGHLHLIRLCGLFVFFTSEISQDGGSSFAAIWSLLSFQKWTVSVIIYSVFDLLVLDVCVRASGHWWHSRYTCERIPKNKFLCTINKIPTLELDQKWHTGSFLNGQINMNVITGAHLIGGQCTV